MKYISILCLLLFNSVIQAQVFPYWGMVSEADLKMTAYENDTSAAAVILVNYGKTRFKIYKNTNCFFYDYHYQIKILKKSAFDEADVKLPFSRQFKIQNLEAITHNWENGKIVSEAVEVFFEKKTSKYKRSKTFAFRNIKVGSIIEFKFTIPRTQIAAPRDFHFQLYYPVKFSEYHFEFPSNYDYQLINPPLEFHEKGDTSYMIYPDGYQPIGIAAYWWKVKNIPALKNEPYVNYIWDYRHHLTMQLTRYRIQGTNIEEEFLSTWDKLAKNYREHKDAGKLYSKSSKIKTVLKITDTFMNESLSEKEKMLKLFDFVRNNIGWTEEYRRYTSQSFKGTFEDGSGNSADINLLLITLLKHYKVKAYPVLIATQDYGYVIKKYPFVGQFNHVIVSVEIDGKMQFLDAVDLTYPYDVLPENSFGADGFMIDNKEGKWVTLTTKRSNDIAIINLEILPNGQIVGELTHRCQSYAANAIRKKIIQIGEENTKRPILSKTFQTLLLIP